jgi:SAM-dependent methyltransferase
MNPKDIGQAYNRITHLWSRESFDRKNGIKQHKRAIAFVKNRGEALDVGCGCTGRLIDLFLEKGFNPEGVDISSEMLKLAKKRHPEIKFHYGNICEWKLPKKYDFISAWDSIWHIPLNQQEKVLEKLFFALNSGGVCVFSCGGVDEPEEYRDDSMGPELYYSTLGISGFLKVISNSNCVCRHLEYDQYPELHTYFIIQKT